MTRIVTQQVRLIINGYSLSLEKPDENDIDEVLPTTRSRAENGRIVTIRESRSLLRGEPNAVSGFPPPTVNIGLLELLQRRFAVSDTEITVERRTRFAQLPVEEISGEQLSNHSFAAREFMLSNPHGLITACGGLSIESAVASVASAFSTTRVLLLSNSHRLNKKFFRRFEMRPRLLFERRRRDLREDQLRRDIQLVISTPAQSWEIFTQFNVVIVLDLKVLNSRYFHNMLSRHEGLVPRVYGLIPESEANHPTPLELLATFGTARLNLSPDDRVRKRCHWGRVAYQHDQRPNSRVDDRTVLIQKVLENHRRHDFIATLATSYASSHIRRWPAVHESQGRCNLVLLVDELHHAAQLLQRLPQWKLVCRLSDSEVVESSLPQNVRNTILRAKRLWNYDGIVCLSNAMKLAKQYPCDIAVYAGATTRIPNIPHQWQYCRTRNADFRLIDIQDCGVRLLDNLTRLRAASLQQCGFPRVGTSERELLFRSATETRSRA